MKGVWAANESSPGGKGDQRALDGWGRVVLVVDFARAAKGLVNLIKESRVYLEGDCKVPEVFKAGCDRIRSAGRKNCSGFRAEIGLGKGTGGGREPWN